MSDLIKKLLLGGYTLCVFGCSQDAANPLVPAMDLGFDVGDSTSVDVGDVHEDSAVDMPPVPDEDWSSDIDMESDIAEPVAECICTDPLATCHPLTGFCVRQDINCGAQECPEGYRCTSPPDGTPYCSCDGSYDECGPFCDENENCPGTRLICDTNPQGGVCRGALPCEDDYQCGPGKVCTYVERVDRDVCIRSGGKQVGEACSNRIECESRLCLDGVCTPFCKVNSDCGEGEVCEFGLNFVPADSNGCVAGTCSAEGCDETQSRCVDYGSTPEDQYCFGASCNVSGDCTGADCILELGTNRAGECDVPEAGEVPDCKPGEFRAWDGDPYCRLADPCWGSSVCGAGTEFGEECHDCPALYDCLQPDTNFAGRSSLSFCSRLVE